MSDPVVLVATIACSVVLSVYASRRYLMAHLDTGATQPQTTYECEVCYARNQDYDRLLAHVRDAHKPLTPSDAEAVISEVNAGVDQ